MLGRLRMSIEECENAYRRLSERIFNPKRSSLNYAGRAKDFLSANGRFDSTELELAIKEIIQSRNLSEEALLKDPSSSCHV
jgi:hypothetical protein